jgi:hypothetical protein
MANDPGEDLAPELRAFIHTFIESIEQVELLMLLRGSDRPRTAREIAVALRVSPAAARHDVETLAARGLLEIRVGDETGYRYRPKSEELGRYCDLLAQHYIVARQTVLGYIATSGRLSIKRFADAFKLRDPEK